ncbi:hypothetical protein HDU85_004978 [Gaertneriomyces sp. JEL0708]|nr:hypothetical protein HDU85_004978 [Gaertneriomyces sp. JEL0708]
MSSQSSTRPVENAKALPVPTRNEQPAPTSPFAPKPVANSSIQYGQPKSPFAPSMPIIVSPSYEPDTSVAPPRSPFAPSPKVNDMLQGLRIGIPSVQQRHRSNSNASADKSPRSAFLPPGDGGTTPTLSSGTSPKTGFLQSLGSPFARFTKEENIRSPADAARIFFEDGNVPTSVQSGDQGKGSREESPHLNSTLDTIIDVNSQPSRLAPNPKRSSTESLTGSPSSTSMSLSEHTSESLSSLRTSNQSLTSQHSPLLSSSARRSSTTLPGGGGQPDDLNSPFVSCAQKFPRGLFEVDADWDSEGNTPWWSSVARKWFMD